MTIALGIPTADAMILAADTQHSTDSEKMGRGKLYTLVQPFGETGKEAGMITVTGAGDSSCLQALQVDLAALFSKTHTESMDELEAAMAKLVKQFYKEYIAIAPDMTQRPEVELIIVARRGLCSGMWVTSKNRISKAQGPVAVGIGSTYAYSLLDRLCLPQHSDTAMMLAAYIIFLVKKRIPWCGEDTHVICMDEKRHPFRLGGNDCRKLEDLFRRYLIVEARLFHRVFGSELPFCSAERVYKDIEDLRDKLVGIIHPSSARSSDPPQV